MNIRHFLTDFNCSGISDGDVNMPDHKRMRFSMALGVYIFGFNGSITLAPEDMDWEEKKLGKCRKYFVFF
jgi:hypothetical protein